MKREPIFGANAKAFLVQAAAAIIVALLAKALLGDWFYDLIRTGVDAIMG